MAIDFIQDLVNKNMTWTNIKSMIRLDKKTLVHLVGDTETREVPIALLINYQHVYYRINKLLEKRAKLDGDFGVSLEKWGSKVSNEHEPIHGYWEYENLSLPLHFGCQMLCHRKGKASCLDGHQL